MSASVRQMLHDPHHRDVAGSLHRCRTSCVRVRQTLLRQSLIISFLALCDAAALAQTSAVFPGPKPSDALSQWKQWIGEYGPDAASFLVLEKNGKLVLRKSDGTESILATQGETVVLEDRSGGVLTVRFPRDAADRVRAITLGDLTLPRRRVGPENGQVFRIAPARPIEELRKEALAASPPREDGTFHSPDLVELASLDRAIHLDVRYATSHDFLGAPVYTQARAFLQRPAAEAVLRALQRLKPLGYGLLIHDAYRPWYVTKIFWDATPPEGKIFVADPAQGSRHNRGCAVDLTLYELQTGKPIEMPGTYDEMSPRSFPDYPGGTSLQRWHRDLLRWSMESEGFTVYEHEWWHFDFKDWHAYPILNVPFEQLQFSQKMQAK
jgi:D-alanyl-D-alanine dipeptidase